MKSFLSKVVFIVILFAQLAFADSGTITITGTVLQTATISPGMAATLTDSELRSGVTDKLIAIVNEKSNKHNGYTVTLQSLNAGTGTTTKLKGNIIANTDEIIYTIKYNNISVVLNNGQAVVTDSNSKTTGSGIDKNLTISFSSGFPSADSYSDVITLTLINK